MDVGEKPKGIMWEKMSVKKIEEIPVLMHLKRLKSSR